MPGKRSGRPEAYPNYQPGMGQPPYYSQPPERSSYLDEGLAETARYYSNLPSYSSSSYNYPHLEHQLQFNDMITTNSHASTSNISPTTPSSAHPPPRSSSLQAQYSPTSETYESEASGSEGGRGGGSGGGATPQHSWVQVGDVTTTRHLSHLVIEGTAANNGTRTFFCGYTGCTHPVGFPHKSQLVTHIRSVHLQEKPFLCVTCKTPFARKQDAVRHVTTANSGLRYKCNICEKTFARKSYRDSHQDHCVQRTMMTNYNRTHASSSASGSGSGSAHLTYSGSGTPAMPTATRRSTMTPSTTSYPPSYFYPPTDPYSRR